MTTDPELQQHLDRCAASLQHLNEVAAEQAREAKKVLEQHLKDKVAVNAASSKAGFENGLMIMEIDPDGLRDPSQEYQMVVTKEQAITIYYALQRYQKKARKDLTSKYNNSERYSVEDDAFLGQLIGTISNMMFEMEQANVLL